MDVGSVVSGMKEEGKTKLDRLGQLEKRIEDVEKAMREADLKNLKDKLSRLSAEVNILSESMGKSDVAKELKKYDEKIKDVYSSIGQQKVNLDTLEATIESLKAEISSWKAEEEKVMRKIDEIETKISDIKSRMGKMDILEADIEHLSENMQILVDELADVKRITIQNTEVQTQMIEADEKLKDLVRKAVSAMITREEFEKGLSELGRPTPKTKELVDEKLRAVRESLKRIISGMPEAPKVEEIGGTTPGGEKVMVEKTREEEKEEKPEEKEEERVKPKKAVSEVPVVEEITIGEELKKSDFEEKVESLVDSLQKTDPRKWDPIKKELTDTLNSKLSDLRGKIGKKKPANAAALNLLLTKAELGIISLSAAFEGKSYERIVAIVNKTLETIRNIEEQF